MDEMNDEHLLQLLDEGALNQLKTEANEMNPADIADFFEKVPKEKRLLVFRLLTKDNGADAFSFMDNDMQEEIISAISDQEMEHIIDELAMDDVVDFLGEMPANVVTRVLRNTDESTRKIINQFLNYPDDSAGSLMTIEFLGLALGFLMLLRPVLTFVAVGYLIAFCLVAFGIECIVIAFSDMGSRW